MAVSRLHDYLYPVSVPSGVWLLECGLGHHLVHLSYRIRGLISVSVSVYVCVCVCPGGSGSNMDSRLILDAQAGYLRACVCVCVCVQVSLCVCPDGSEFNKDSRLCVCVPRRVWVQHGLKADRGRPGGPP